MHIRPATIRDCADLAILDDIAGHGLPLSLWRRAVLRGKAGNALEWGREGFADLSQPANWRNAHIAEVDGETAGMAVGYFVPPGTLFPADANPVLTPILALFARAAGTWMIDALSIYSRFRRRGIARALLRDQISRAGALDASIVTANDNATALALYRGEGFTDVAREDFIPYDDRQTTRYWLFLQRRHGQ